ncbi:MAG: hypothetical protein GOMPHAMPRED_004295 [Gomphillus americanus]|uniref:Uncharacterized protein n=1 Tax=Gomphillus americanus TaxID=1940652 RepID=A0A8H3IUF7_9LECA|nr:MAG: hypothetical protein GOMPHAMPRED_004295 [Gomphillus americanus]
MPRKPRLAESDRRYSWPPFKLSFTTKKKDIDEDPFSYFMEPLVDESPLNSANVGSNIRSRSLSPRTASNKDKVLKSPVISRLRQWVQNMEVRYLHVNRGPLSDEITQLPTPPRTPSPSPSSKRPASPEEEPEMMLDVIDITSSPSQRGRRRTRTARRQYGDRTVRSHSKKARVWREPDSDLWSVLEEPDDVGLGIQI